MEISSLQCFVRICDHGSISRAAEELYISRQSVSRSLIQLEKELSVQLVVRRHDGIELTEKGSYFYQQAKRILDIYQETCCAISQHPGHYRKTLRVGFGRASFNFFADKDIHTIKGHFPGLSIEIKAMLGDELYEALIKNELDIAVSNGNFQSKNLSCRTLLKKSVVGVFRADDPLAGKAFLELSDLNGKDILVVQKNETFVQDLQKAFSVHHIDGRIRYLRSLDPVGILHEINNAQNFVHLTADFFSDLLRPGGQFAIRELRTEEKKINKNIRAYYQNSHADDVVIQAYINLLRHVVAN